jgi:hypothetical protein
VNAVLALFTVVLLVLSAIGIYSLQTWLERWDRDGHLQD